MVGGRAGASCGIADPVHHGSPRPRPARPPHWDWRHAALRASLAPGGKVGSSWSSRHAIPTTGLLVGYVPGWPGAHSQGETIDELRANLREVVQMLLEDGEPELEAEFVGTATFRVASMPPVPPVKPREIASILSRLGFAEVRQRGSHKQFRHADGRATTVPFHEGRDVAPTLVRKIIQDIRIEIADFPAQR